MKQDYSAPAWSKNVHSRISTFLEIDLAKSFFSILVVMD